MGVTDMQGLQSTGSLLGQNGNAPGGLGGTGALFTSLSQYSASSAGNTGSFMGGTVAWGSGGGMSASLNTHRSAQSDSGSSQYSDDDEDSEKEPDLEVESASADATIQEQLFEKFKTDATAHHQNLKHDATDHNETLKADARDSFQTFSNIQVDDQLNHIKVDSTNHMETLKAQATLSIRKESQDERNKFIHTSSSHADNLKSETVQDIKRAKDDAVITVQGELQHAQSDFRLDSSSHAKCLTSKAVQDINTARDCSISQMQDKHDSQLQGVNSLAEKFSGLSTDVDGLKKDVSNLQNEVQAVAGRLDAFDEAKTESAKFHIQMNQQKEKIEQLENSVNESKDDWIKYYQEKAEIKLSVERIKSQAKQNATESRERINRIEEQITDLQFNGKQFCDIFLPKLMHKAYA
jgi:hypothetical protein